MEIWNSISQTYEEYHDAAMNYRNTPLRYPSLITDEKGEVAVNSSFRTFTLGLSSRSRVSWRWIVRHAPGGIFVIKSEWTTENEF